MNVIKNKGKYRVNVQGQGWLTPAANGQWTGSTGLCKRMEGIEIGIYPKGTVSAATIEHSWTLGGGAVVTGETFLTNQAYTSCK